MQLKDMIYHDMTIEVAEARRTRAEDRRMIGRFKVRVFASPAGEMAPDQAVPVEYDDGELQQALRQLDTRELDRAGLIALGRTLALLLLPPGPAGATVGVRELFAGSLKMLGPDAGLRLRLRLPHQLAAIPWEYLYVDRAGGGDGMDGFLALDPRVAIVRHEALAVPVAATKAGPIRLVAAFSANPDLPPLNLGQEIANLEAALDAQPGIEKAIIENATLTDIQDAIQQGAAIFHFAGHGIFNRNQMTDAPGVYSGAGLLALDDQFVDAEQLGINLRGHSLRLAVLAGCETGRRDGINVWSGVAPSLVKAEIPAVVANQYSIRDDCAIAFSQQFYRALVGGLPIEAAVTAGRIAAYNKNKEGRDWGVPVLYLRAGDGQLFAGSEDAEVRAQARKGAEVDVNLRVKEVAAGGEVLGARVREMLQGKLSVTVGVSGTVYGKVVGATFDRIGGGSAKVEMDIGTVGQGGNAIGVVIDSL
ncbi:MAG: CHAT domain-containing protein [Anaerolineae bacterium]